MVSGLGLFYRMGYLLYSFQQRNGMVLCVLKDVICVFRQQGVREKIGSQRMRLRRRFIQSNSVEFKVQGQL